MILPNFRGIYHFSRPAVVPPVPEIVTSGLILHLDAGNSSSYPGSGTTWSDLSGNSINGTLTNGPIYSSSNGGIITFDGSNDWSSHAWKSALNTTSVTILVFATSPSQTNGAFRSFLSKNGGSPPTVRDYSLYTYNDTGTTGTPNKLHFSSTNTAWISLDLPGGRPSAGSWHQWGAYCSSSETGYIYDGTKYEYGTPAALPIRNYNLQIARAGEGGYIGSSISTVLLYNRVLSSSEVQQNFDATRGRFGI